MNNTPIDKSYENDVGKFIEFKGKFAGSRGMKRSGMIQLVSVVDVDLLETMFVSL